MIVEKNQEILPDKMQDSRNSGASVIETQSEKKFYTSLCANFLTKTMSN